NFKSVDLREPVMVIAPENEKYAEWKGGIFETTVGRILFNNVLPADYAFINKEVDRKRLSAIIDDMITIRGANAVAPILDAVKAFGFGYATSSGTTWGIDDIMVPDAKNGIVTAAKRQADIVTQQFTEGLLTEEERIRKHIEIWQKAKSDVEKAIPSSLDRNG